MLLCRAGNSSCCFFGSLAPLCVSFRVFSYKLHPCKRIEINSIPSIFWVDFRVKFWGGTVFGCWGVPYSVAEANFPLKLWGYRIRLPLKLGVGTVFGCCCFEGKFRLKFQRKKCNFSLEISPECARPPYSVCVPNLWWYYDTIAIYYNIQYYSTMRLQHYNAIILL